MTPHNTEQQGGTFVPPAVWSHVTENDEAVLTAQMKNRRFSMSLVYMVAHRCSFGFPQVIVCCPVSDKGSPFPTMFWLTCPYLNRVCGELESLQKIKELEEVFKQRIDDVTEWHKSYSALRCALNPSAFNISSSCGVGGINYKETPFAAKCLHLQTGTWLGLGAHPASDWLRQNIASIECSDACCLRSL